MLTLGIDASNLRQGGGITHLRELLTAAEVSATNFGQIIVWGARATLDELPVRKWLTPVHQSALERGRLSRLYWQSRTLAGLAERSVDILFVPGGTYQGSYRPFVTMSRNLLPFDPPERARYDGTLIGARLRLLSVTQSRSFRKADGVIFLTRTAKKTVTAITGELAGRTRVIPHGVGEAFFQSPRSQRDISFFDRARPFRWVYVSIVDLYKHQARVAEAAGILRAQGLPLSVDFIGPAYSPSLRELEATMKKVDPHSEFLRYRGPIGHSELPREYVAANGAVFASSCENMPNILLESMASGLPIACSDRSVMPEVLGDGGVYFDPEWSASIGDAIKTLMLDPELRSKCAANAHRTAREYSWSRCATETFSFLHEVASASPRMRTG